MKLAREKKNISIPGVILLYGTIDDAVQYFTPANHVKFPSVISGFFFSQQVLLGGGDSDLTSEELETELREIDSEWHLGKEDSNAWRRAAEKGYGKKLA